jgi:hypothetical protein
MGSWLAYVDVDLRDTFVLSFDISDEIFLITPLLDNVIGQNLFVLNKSIVMVAPKKVDEEWSVFSLVYGCCLKLVLRTPGLGFLLLDRLQVIFTNY